MNKRLSIGIIVTCLSSGLMVAAQNTLLADSVLVLNKEKALTIALSEIPR